MPCYHPLKGYFSEKENKTGKRPLVFCSDKALLPIPQFVPCGSCIGCRLDRSKQWAIRCVHEASLHDDNCFITLTFDNKHLRSDGSLDKTDFQKFMKRLRKAIYPKQVRYFHCAEYGPKFLRPHHHALLFGFDFPDKLVFDVKGKKKDGAVYFVSPLLQSLWSFGFSMITAVNEDTAAYCSRYILKKHAGTGMWGEELHHAKKLHYGEREPEFITMSLKPAIGQKWYDRFRDEVYQDGCVIFKSYKIKAPKFYDSKYEIDFPFQMCMIKSERERRASLKDNSPAKLAVREEVLLSSLNQYKRGYEDGT